jgi:hypothetical protein
MSIFPPLYNDSSLFPYRRIPPLYNNVWPITYRYLLPHIMVGPCSLICGFLLYTLNSSYLLLYECLSSTSSSSILLLYKWISLFFSLTVIASALYRRLPLPVLYTPIAPLSDLRSIIRG